MATTCMMPHIMLWSLLGGLEVLGVYVNLSIVDEGALVETNPLRIDSLQLDVTILI